MYRHDGSTWQVEDLLYVSDPPDRFGYGLGMDENQIIIGCYDYYSMGMVYIFRWDGTDWVQDAALEPGAYCWYGRSVDIQGNIAVVGGPNDPYDGRQGRAYIYTCTGPPGYEWSEAAVIEAIDGRWNDWFGEAVAVADERTVVVQAMYHELDGYGGSTLYVFHQQGAEWVEAARLTTEDGSGAFGYQASDSLAADGTRVVVGSMYTSPNGLAAGSAYYYDLARVLTWHVDPGAPAGGDGFTWETAIPYLQDALQEAPAGVTIKVAAGTYKPDRDAMNPGGTGDREAAFVIPEGVTLKGGYAGYGAPDPDANDPTLYPTILSGDLDGDDQPGFVNRSDNSRHIVIASGADETTVTVEGLILSGGYSDEDSPDPYLAGGSALLCDGVGLRLADSIITDNHTGRAGGAVYTRQNTALIERCTFLNNGGGYGAALNTRTGSATVARSSFWQQQRLQRWGHRQ